MPPFQSKVCVVGSKTVNAFGMNFKDDTDLTVAGRDIKCDSGHSLTSARDPTAAK